MAGPSQSTLAGGVRAIRGWAIAAGVLLIIGGIVALMAPFIAALVATLWVAWGLVFGGIAELVSAYGYAENRVWKVVLGVRTSRSASTCWCTRGPGSPRWP